MIRESTFVTIVICFVTIVSEARAGSPEHLELSRTKPMNVLMIAIDDLNNYPSTLKNYPGVKTPNLDEFAKTAMRFNRAYCPGTMCNSSRSAILSGIAPYRSGLYQNGQPWQQSPLLRRIKTLPRAFRESGYHTMGCGKLYHSKPSPEQWKAQWDDTEGGKGKFAPRSKPNPIPNSVERPGAFNYGVATEKQISDFQLIQYAENRLEASYEKPFFMAHGIRYPHNPWVVPQRFLDLYPDEDFSFPPIGFKEGDLDDLPSIAKKYASRPVNRKDLAEAGHWKPVVRHYLASISAADDVFGEIIKALDSSDYAANTIVIVWADHGFHMGEKDHFAKYALWEQTTNVLFMVRVPGMTTGGESCGRTVSLQDIYPTLVELCSLKDPGHRLDGRSIVPLLKSPSTPWPYPAITTHLKNDHAVRTESHRYIRYNDGSEELYEEATDPYEWNNLAVSPTTGSQTIIEKLKAFLPTENVDAVSSKAQKNKERKKKTPRKNRRKATSDVGEPGSYAQR